MYVAATTAGAHAKRFQACPEGAKGKLADGRLLSSSWLGGRHVWGPGVFDHARAQQSEDAITECAMTSALTHFRERSRNSLLMADFCSSSSGSTHVLNTMRFAASGVGPPLRLSARSLSDEGGGL